ncbi:MAG: zinc metalloprotease HtpX [Chloroflexota bacterium]|nr:zinc metalloprotease HtpX [Chloroflexota bacterium]MDE2884301.1 zinc metalloprotease HtpX [Chloroflexota bacterium]
MIQPRRIGRDNQLRARMLFTMLLLGLVYGLFLWFLVSVAGAAVMLGFAIVLVLVQFILSDKLVLVSMRAKVVTPEEAPQLHAMVDRLAMTAGIPKPKVAIADMNVPNAFATGRSQKHAAVAVTTGLMRILNERELEGVLAHEISHIASRDVQVMTYASFLSVVASTLMGLFFWMGLFGGFGRSRGSGGSYIMIAYLVTILVWVISQVLIAALSRYREYAADRGAAALTNRPRDLANALQRIGGSITGLPQNDLRRAETLNAFFIMPAIGDGFASLFSTHPPMARRIERLLELERTGMLTG